MTTLEEQEQGRRACHAVGELVLLASALDNQISEICIPVLGLIETSMLLPAIASIDSSRKVDILKSFSRKVNDTAWRRELKRYAEAVEEINRARNIAAHSLLTFEHGTAVLSSFAAAKLFKAIDMKTKTASVTSIKDIEAAARKCEQTLGHGIIVLENFERLAHAVKERRQKRG